MRYPVVHFEILGPNGPATVAFYRDLFGWNLRQVPMTGYDSYAYLPQPDRGIGGGIGRLKPDDPAGERLVTVYVEVPDLQATLDQALRAGAEVVLPPSEIEGVGTIARFRDPQGNIIGLVRSATS